MTFHDGRACKYARFNGGDQLVQDGGKKVVNEHSTLLWRDNRGSKNGSMARYCLVKGPTGGRLFAFIHGVAQMST